MEFSYFIVDAQSRKMMHRKSIYSAANAKVGVPADIQKLVHAEKNKERDAILSKVATSILVCARRGRQARRDIANVGLSTDIQKEICSEKRVRGRGNVSLH